jgi:hypothetical protein
MTDRPKYVTFIAVVLAIIMEGRCFGLNLRINENKPQFGGARMGESRAPKTLSISNMGHDPVLLLSIYTSDNFAQNSNCKVWLAEGSTCLVFVTFRPQIIGPITGKLTIRLAGGKEQAVPLSGVGLSERDANRIQDKVYDPHKQRRGEGPGIVE